MAEETKAHAPRRRQQQWRSEARSRRTLGDRGGPRGPRPGGGPGGPREGGRKYFRRKKVCKFCVEKIEASELQRCTAPGAVRGRERQNHAAPPNRRMHACINAVCHRAIKQARNIALLPFAGRAQ